MKIFILIIILILFNKYAYSNNLFDTTFYDVEFTSKNIEDDKIQAINEIKIKSILSILKNTLTENDYAKINKQLTDDLINTFIKDGPLDFRNCGNIILISEFFFIKKYFL